MSSLLGAGLGIFLCALIMWALQPIRKKPHDCNYRPMPPMPPPKPKGPAPAGYNGTHWFTIHIAD